MEPDEEFTEERRKDFSPGSKLMMCLGRLESSLENVLNQVTEMNGAQKTLVQRVTAIELFDRVHPLECPLKDKLLDLKREFDQHVVTTNAIKTTNKTWWENLKPAILLLAGGVLVLLAKHLDTWWK